MSPREIVHTDGAPQAIGTYSQAVCCGSVVYLSGQIALDPKTMELVADSMEAEIRQVFDNVSAVCKAAGGSLAQVAKLQIYLTDLAHFGRVNTIMADYLAEPYPARAAIGVASLPRGARIEIDGVLVLD